MSPAFKSWFAQYHGCSIAVGCLLAMAAAVPCGRFSLSAISSGGSPAQTAGRHLGSMPPTARNTVLSTREGSRDTVEPTDPLARALATVSFKRRAHRFEHFGASLAATDVENAFRTLAGLDVTADREAFIRGVFRTLARGDKVKAMLTTRRLADKSEEDTALMALVNVWVGPNNAFINHDYRSQSDNPAAGFGQDIVFNNYSDNDHTDLLALWARTLTRGKDQAELLTLAASNEYWINPVLAESYGAELTGSERAAFNFALLRVKPFDAAWREGSALADPKARAEAQTMLLAQISEGGEPGLAAEHLAELPQKQHTDVLFSYIAGYYGMMDNPGAWKWLDTLFGKDADLARAYVTR